MPSDNEYQAWLHGYNARMRFLRKESYALQDKAKRVGWLVAIEICLLILSLSVLNSLLVFLLITATSLTVFYRHVLIKRSIKLDDERVRAVNNKRYFEHG